MITSDQPEQQPQQPNLPDAELKDVDEHTQPDEIEEEFIEEDDVK